MVLLLVHFPTEDASATYMLEPRLIGHRNFKLADAVRAIERIHKANQKAISLGEEGVGCDVVTDRAMTLLYGASGWSYFYGACGETINQIEEVFV